MEILKVGKHKVGTKKEKTKMNILDFGTNIMMK